VARWLLRLPLRVARWRGDLTMESGCAILVPTNKEEQMESYTVRLDNGKITYSPSTYECDDCGWAYQDRSFFYEKDNKLVCSLHLEEQDADI
jgi:hypothetical protein